MHAGLRVIAGRAKGRRLKTLPGSTTRPVMDRVKEALFDIVGGDVVDSSWWDLFGGTGAVGIEALSRGARFVRFTELDPRVMAVLRTNVALCGFEAQAELIRGDALKLVDRAPDRSFDYLYVAPPQYRGLWMEALNVVDAQAGWMGEDGWIIVQIDPKEALPIALNAFVEFDERPYGKTLLKFLQKKPRPE